MYAKRQRTFEGAGPYTFTAPVTPAGFWDWVAGEPIEELNCALPEAG
ncbi:MAG: hypothetical protein OEQ25_08435 [Gammaproteobacteria bacterium]|nr:hypothetical protein [Gammaproteobacteria bacterium]